MVKVFNTGPRPRREVALTAWNNLNVRLSRKYAARLGSFGATMVIFAAPPAAARDPGKKPT